MNRGSPARSHLAFCRSGVLSTLSQRYGGHPFGSLVPYVLDHQARPVILISRLAEHTKNIEADARVSLLAHNEAHDPQAGARVTLLGNAVRVEVSSLAALRYQRYFPASDDLFALGDFSFFALEPFVIRFIEGFGSIHWISAAEYAPSTNSLAEAEADIVAHMNAEHSHNLRDYCRHAYGNENVLPMMVGLDCDGFDLRAGEKLLRFTFESPVTSAAEARASLAALATASRAA